MACQIREAAKGQVFFQEKTKNRTKLRYLHSDSREKMGMIYQRNKNKLKFTLKSQKIQVFDESKIQLKFEKKKEKWE